MVRRQRFFVRVGIVVGAFLLLTYWWIAVAAFLDGQMFAHTNYWGAPIGTLTVVIVLVALTPAWFWAARRYWNWQGHTVSDD